MELNTVEVKHEGQHQPSFSKKVFGALVEKDFYVNLARILFFELGAAFFDALSQGFKLIREKNFGAQKQASLPQPSPAATAFSTPSYPSYQNSYSPPPPVQSSYNNYYGARPNPSHVPAVIHDSGTFPGFENTIKK